MMPQSNIFNSKISGFATLLDKLGSEKNGMSDYAHRYLQYLLRHRFYFLHIYASVLEKALAKSNKPVEEISLIDYGAGNGLLGIFAKYCGCKKVFLCDTAPNFVAASKIIASKLEFSMDGFVHGDIDEFRVMFPRQKVDWVIGTDVIEHIYDLDLFFDSIQKIKPEMVTVFTTASNPDNYFKVKKLRDMQLHDELQGGDPADFELAGEEAHPPYLEIRREIITNSAPQFSPKEIEQITMLTRGKNKTDIEAAVEKYKASGTLPDAPGDPWNTCHPLTGSWSERVLPIATYRTVYEQHGFCLELRNGFYDRYSKTSKRFFNYFMNLLMKIMGKKIAPFITLTGFPKHRNPDIC